MQAGGTPRGRRQWSINTMREKVRRVQIAQKVEIDGVAVSVACGSLGIHRWWNKQNGLASAPSCCCVIQYPYGVVDSIIRVCPLRMPVLDVVDNSQIGGSMICRASQVLFARVRRTHHTHGASCEHMRTHYMSAMCDVISFAKSIIEDHPLHFTVDLNILAFLIFQIAPFTCTCAVH